MFIQIRYCVQRLIEKVNIYPICVLFVYIFTQNRYQFIQNLSFYFQNPLLLWHIYPWISEIFLEENCRNFQIYIYKPHTITKFFAKFQQSPLLIINAKLAGRTNSRSNISNRHLPRFARAWKTTRFRKNIDPPENRPNRKKTRAHTHTARKRAKSIGKCESSFSSADVLIRLQHFPRRGPQQTAALRWWPVLDLRGDYGTPQDLNIRISWFVNNFVDNVVPIVEPCVTLAEPKTNSNCKIASYLVDVWFDRSHVRSAGVLKKDEPGLVNLFSISWIMQACIEFIASHSHAKSCSFSAVLFVRCEPTFSRSFSK